MEAFEGGVEFGRSADVDVLAVGERNAFDRVVAAKSLVEDVAKNDLAAGVGIVREEGVEEICKTRGPAGATPHEREFGLSGLVDGGEDIVLGVNLNHAKLGRVVGREET